MDVQEALKTRRSIRAFSATPVPPQLIDDILLDALESPSWGNTQPYRIAVATGATLDQLRQELTEKFRVASKLQKASLHQKLLAWLRPGVLPDGDYSTQIKYPPELLQRYRETGKGLYQTLRIEREDRVGRDAQMARNFQFFDAPVGLFVFAHESLGMFGALDAGIFMQSLALAAHDRGLGTCLQAALATWASPVRRHFQVAEGYKLLCGMSMGYPLPEPVNAFKPNRRDLTEVVLPTRIRVG